jgi:hypothetical protein
MFLPPPGQGELGSTSNVLSGGAVTAYQTAVDGFLDDIATAGGQMVIFHPLPATAFSLVTSLHVETRLATQRGRLRD